MCLGTEAKQGFSFGEEPLRAGSVLGGVEVDVGKNVGWGRLGWGPQVVWPHVGVPFWGHMLGIQQYVAEHLGF